MLPENIGTPKLMKPCWPPLHITFTVCAAKKSKSCVPLPWKHHKMIEMIRFHSFSSRFLCFKGHFAKYCQGRPGRIESHFILACPEYVTICSVAIWWCTKCSTCEATQLEATMASNRSNKNTVAASQVLLRSDMSCLLL